MHALSEQQLMNIWEQGQNQSPAERALTLLAASTGRTRDDLAMLTVGQRDNELLALREQIFGSKLLGLLRCPNCNELLELALDVSNLMLIPSKDASETICLNAGDHELYFRVPNSQDLIELQWDQDLSSARKALLKRCVLTAKRNGMRISTDGLPSEVINLIAARMAEADSQGDLQISVCCLSCNHFWQVLFDIVSFLWNEVHAWGQSTMREVHILASAYNWSEDQILAISPWRRRLYISMVGQ